MTADVEATAVMPLPPGENGNPHRVQPIGPAIPPAPAVLPRPAVLAFKALARFYGLFPHLPDLVFTVRPAGDIVGQVPDELGPGDAETTLHLWARALSHEGPAYSETGRNEGPFHWAELHATIPVSHPDNGPRVTLVVIGRRWATPQPLTPALNYSSAWSPR